MSQTITIDSIPKDLTSQKQELLLTFYRICWDEMCWRRNAGYRTIIIGLGYCGVLLTAVAFNHQMPVAVRACLAAVITLATLFGAGYLTSNYRKYMSALARMVAIEEHVGAFDADFLGSQGALMPAKRRSAPQVPITRDAVCLWSVIAFAAGGLVTAAAILML
jgi:hypothetical protein